MNNKLIKPGDLVELLPTNQRNRQLRKQEGKLEWTVIKIDSSVICFDGDEGLMIQSIRLIVNIHAGFSGKTLHSENIGRTYIQY